MDASNRILLLPEFVAEMLKRRRGSTLGEYVFPSSTGTMRSPANFRLQWRDFRSSAEHGYPNWVTPKTFRKTVATLLRDEVDIGAAGGQLGDSGTKVAKEHCARLVFEAPDQTAVLQRFAG